MSTEPQKSTEFQEDKTSHIPSATPMQEQKINIGQKAPSAAELFKFGLQYEDCGDMKNAASSYQLAASRGHVRAQAFLGKCYEYGAGVEVNMEEAIRLYRLAVAQGDARAQAYLGRCYEYGTGVAINIEEALRLYRLAVAQGDARAQFWLGRCYEYGTGVATDMQEAVRLYRLAVAQGDARAQAYLGRCYENGTGVAKDMQEAVRLYRLAVAQGDARAQFWLGRCYEYGIGVATEDMQEAVRLYRLAVAQGDAGAQAYLGRCYENRTGVVGDMQEAVRLYRLAVAQGDARAQFWLSRCYEEGEGIAKDINEAIRLFRLSVAQGYFEGFRFTQRDYSAEEARQTRCINGPLPPTSTESSAKAEESFNTGMNYKMGRGGAPTDMKTAVSYYQAAAEQGHIGAQLALGYSSIPVSTVSSTSSSTSLSIPSIATLIDNDDLPRQKVGLQLPEGSNLPTTESSISSTQLSITPGITALMKNAASDSPMNSRKPPDIKNESPTKLPTTNKPQEQEIQQQPTDMPAYF